MKRLWTGRFETPAAASMDEGAGEGELWWVLGEKGPTM